VETLIAALWDSKKKPRSSRARPLPTTCETMILLAGHIRGDRPDDGKHELFVLVRLVHQEYPKYEHKQTQQGINCQGEESHGHKMQHGTQNSNDQVNGKNTNRHSDRLRRMKSHEWALVD
jgi:hypothetical protein